VQLEIHGLAIDFESECGGDVVWQRQCAATLAPALHSGVSLKPGPGGIWTHQVFNDLETGITACCFSTSPDGRQVVSQSRDGTDEAELLDVFSEPVMRTVMFRQGLISFHAAALVKDGQAILLMGKKGAGKSSLSAALLQQGWSILADDLVRVAESGGTWHALAGRRQVRLNTDVALALGHRPAAMKRRWADGSTESSGNKLILEVAVPPLCIGGYPIHTICALAIRDCVRASVAVTIPSSFNQVRLLLCNTTPDPGNRRNPPPAGFAAAVSALLRQCQIRSLQLPDRLSELLNTACAIDALFSHRLRPTDGHSSSAGMRVE
jgi:hypothetical protein